VSREQVVDERIGRTVQWCHALDEGGNGDGVLTEGNVTIDPEEIEHKVRSPAEDEHWNKNSKGKSVIMRCDATPGAASPKTMTSVILMLLIFARGITPLELARFIRSFS
jgi:hypothetical protein